MILSATANIDSRISDVNIYSGPIIKILREIKEDGFSGVEMHILDSEKINRNLLYSELNKQNLVLTSIGTGSAYKIFGLSLANSDRIIRDQALTFLKNHMITAQPYHATVIIGLIAGRLSDCKGNKDEYEKCLTESLHKLNDFSAEMEVPVAYEIMNSYESDFLNTLSDGKEFLENDGLDHIMLLADTAHLNIEESNIERAIRLTGSKIGLVQVTDNNYRYPGWGHINFHDILQALKDVDYNGALSVESSPWPDYRTCGRKSVRYLNAMLDSLQ